jgi:predicted dinucleotide-binding enzyme
MKIAIIGAGNVGGALGKRWAALGHEVVFGVRDPGSDKVRAAVAAAGGGARAAGVREAAAGGEVVVLTTPWGATRSAIEAAGDLSGKIVVDCTNPLAGLEGLAIGHTTSAGERVAEWAPGARVVKAFNTTGSNNMENADYGGRKVLMPVCGDDAGAKATVRRLAEEIGFEAVDAGGIASSRLLEPMAMLWIRLAYAQGLGREFGWSIVRR